MSSRFSTKYLIYLGLACVAGLFAFLLFRTPVGPTMTGPTIVERVDRGLKVEDEQMFRTKLDELLLEQAGNEAEGKQDANLFLRLGVQYYVLGEVANAADSYRKILVTNPSDAPALENLGQALYEMGDYVGALEAWQRAATADPTEQTYVRMADLIRDHLPELNSRIPLVMEHGIATLGQKYGFLIRLGDWYASQSDFQRAVSHYEVAVQLNQNSEAANILEEYRQKLREQEADSLKTSN